VTEKEPHLLVDGDIPPKLGRAFTVVGKEIDRIDGIEKATGEAKYAGDVKLPGMLYAKILRSPHAHARIVNIDTSQAEKLPGVKAVISKNNCPGWNTFWYTIQQPAFAEELGHYGQEVAAVAADTIDMASDALRLIKVQYEILPAVFDPEEAMKPGAPTVPSLDQVDVTVSRAPHARPVKNVFEGAPTVLKRGSIDQGFSESDVVVEGDFSTSFQFHATLETRCCVAFWEGDMLTVHDSSQGVWQVRDDLSRSLKIPLEKVRIITKYMGGGFGSKAGAQRFLHYAGKLSMLTGRPVRLELTRPEEFLAHPHRQASKTWIKIGAKKNGKICAIHERIIINLGIGSTYGAQGNKGVEHAFELYDCPNALCEQFGVHTNTPITGYMRSVMRVIGNFPLESIMDDLASKLGMDPIALRLKNYTLFGEQEKKIGYSAKNLDLCIQKVRTESSWEEKRIRYAAENTKENQSVRKGIGISTYLYEGVGLAPYNAKATVEVSKSGEATVYAGFVDIGGGQATMATMLVAEELGLKLEDVNVHWGDTDHTDYSPGTHASRLTAEMGPALVQAAYRVRVQVLALASKRLGVPEDDLVSELSSIFSRKDPSKRSTFAEICADLPEGVTIVGKGSRVPNPRDVAFKTFGAQTAEVEVDIETGSVKVLRITSAHELGRALNPKLCHSQQRGAITMGLGFALYEDPVIDGKTGIVLNTDLHQYRTVSALEVPKIVTFNIEAEDSYFAYSAKGVGEAPLVPVAAAVRNAILFATGAKVNSTPMTPDKVIEAVELAEAQEEVEQIAA
jgi:CO/xanthine dehydrogenase Mo-binding subunit